MKTKMRVCGSILSKDGNILFIDQDTDEAHAWLHHLGWPTEKEIASAKKMGEHFALVEVREKKNANSNRV